MGFDELLDFGDGESVDALVNFFEGNDAIEEVEIASEGGGARGGGFLLHDERAFVRALQRWSSSLVMLWWSLRISATVTSRVS